MGSGENSRNFHSTTTTKFQHFRFHHYSSNQSLIQNSLSTNEKTRNTILRGASLASHTNEIWKCASASHIVPPLRVTTNHHQTNIQISILYTIILNIPPNNFIDFLHRGIFYWFFTQGNIFIDFFTQENIFIDFFTQENIFIDQ